MNGVRWCGTVAARSRRVGQKTRRKLFFESLEMRRLLAGSVSGQVFEDLDADGLFEPASGEKPILGTTVYIDANNDENLGRAAVFVEPDDFVEHAILNDRAAGIRLSAADQFNEPRNDVTSNVHGDASTGTQVFGSADDSSWTTGQRLRVDFHAPGRAISIDFIGGSNVTPQTGRLELFGSEDQLLSASSTAPRMLHPANVLKATPRSSSKRSAARRRPSKPAAIRSSTSTQRGTPRAMRRTM